MPEETTLVLVDGFAVVYRAFYAIRGLATKDGTHTNALFGFVRMLRQLQQFWGPTHMAVVFDGGLPERRTSRLPSYKAQRPAMPDELRSQLPLIDEYLDCAGVTRVVVEGQEADDVIASMAAPGWSHAPRVLVASSDKDLFQIVDQRTRLVSVSGNAEIMDADGVRGKTGVEVGQIVDWLALIGDAADNIPGVPGVGSKTAAKLLNAYGSIEGIWGHLAEISSARLRENLQEYRDVIERNRDLVALDLNVSPGTSLDECRQKPVMPGRLLSFFEKVEFDGMAREYRQGDLFA